MTNRVGIITRTKNRPLLLERAVKSVLCQEHADWLHIVVNDGGEPSEVESLSAKYAREYAGRLKVIHNPTSLGMEAASNVGIKAAEGVKYLVIHDDDDAWHPNFLFESIHHLLQAQLGYPNYKGVVCHSEVIIERLSGDQAIAIDSYSFNNNLQCIALYDIMEVNRFPPISFLFEAKTLEQIGAFDEALPVLGDWEFNIRFLAKFDVVVLPKTLCYYYHREKADAGSYANTVTLGQDRHVAFRAIILNKALRKELSNVNGHFGLAMNLIAAIQQNRNHLEYLVKRKMKKQKKFVVFALALNLLIIFFLFIASFIYF